MSNGERCWCWCVANETCQKTSSNFCMYVCACLIRLIQLYGLRFGCAVCVYWDWLKYSSLFDICTMSVVFQCAYNQINLNIPLNKFNGIDCDSIYNWIALLIVGKLVGLHRHSEPFIVQLPPLSIYSGKMTRKQLFMCDLLQRREIGLLHRNEKHQLTEASNGLADELLVNNNIIKVIIVMLHPFFTNINETYVS